MQLIPQTIPTPIQDQCPHEVSSVLEACPAAPLSTHWMPLHELIEHWTTVDTLLTPAPVAPVLAAVGHALLALASETCALRCYTLACQQPWEAFAPATAQRFGQVERQLHQAGHHWSRA